MKYVLFWLCATFWCKDPFIGFIILLLATYFFEEDKPKEEPAKKE